jgi:hypothetical protein
MRYPRAVCNTCKRKTKTGDGRKIIFNNIDTCGGFISCINPGAGQQPIVGEEHSCYINSCLCRADEAHFGGIVVQVVQVIVRNNIRYNFDDDEKETEIIL